jgi:hypothetical protein
MPHHFTKGTVGASIWCGKCGKMTPWRVAGGKRSYCIPCYDKKGEVKAVEPVPAIEQGSLFGEMR